MKQNENTEIEVVKTDINYRGIRSDEQIKQIGESLLRLKQNPDYKLVFENFFETQEVVRIGCMIGRQEIKDEFKSEFLKDLTALSRFFAMIDYIEDEYYILIEEESELAGE